MNQSRRMAIVLGTVAVAIVAFLLLRPDDDPAPSSSAATTPAVVEATATTPTTATPDAKPRAKPRPPRPTVPAIVVRDLKPVGGVAKLKLRKGQVIRFTVRSDQAEEAHLHGYDVSRAVGPGTVATFAVPAEIEGIVELELEHSGVPIAEITVEP